ncbi:hypothetical protein ABT095_00815 [Kitasatospora sp. NPDC002227]|uniref:ATP-binding protein n=1 Tax=Kitasatospora sp. NPDC002227 TaxID=3154773 RepID=UPI0033233556
MADTGAHHSTGAALRAGFLRTAAALLAQHNSLLLHGPTGIGRTTVARTLAARSGWAVLRCAPASSESHLPYVGLVDLFDGLPAPAHLPPEQRARQLAFARPEPEPEETLANSLATAAEHADDSATAYELAALAADRTPATPVVVGAGGGTTDLSGEDEVELDIEVVQALAPGAAIKVYEAPNSDAGETAVYAKLVSDNVPVISISWGIYEAGETASNRVAVDTDLNEAAAQGQSVTGRHLGLLLGLPRRHQRQQRRLPGRREVRQGHRPGQLQRRQLPEGPARLSALTTNGPDRSPDRSNSLELMTIGPISAEMNPGTDHHTGTPRPPLPLPEAGHS